jgi:DNA-binding NtrC family response regulator
MKTILFVDDNEALARLSSHILDQHGYRAVPAYNAEQALALLDKQDFDLLITDFRMEGMNGLQLARAVHARNPFVPVIIVTAYGPLDTGDEAKACLPKEGLFPNLLETIQSVLRDTDAQEQQLAGLVREA